MKAPNDNKFVFTEAKIAKLPFAEPGKRYQVRDANTRNLYLRVTRSSKKYYMVKKVRDKSVFVLLGDVSNTTLNKAKERLAEQLDVVQKGKNPNVEKNKIQNTITVQEFFEQYYFPQHSKLYKKTSSQREDECTFRVHLGTLYNVRVVDINRPMVELFQRRIAQQSTIYAANHAVKLLRQMLNKALDWGLIQINPVARTKLFKEVQRDRFLQPDELERLFVALEVEPNVSFRNLVLLSLLIGQRRGNMQALKWTDISFERAVVYFPDTKTGNPQVVPLPAQAIDILREMETFKTSEWLFPSKRAVSGHIESPSKMWKALLKRANIENLRMHDLRRTFASYQAITGSSYEIIGKALGDKSPAVIPTYARLSEAPVRQSIQKGADAMMPRKIDKIKQGVPNENI